MYVVSKMHFEISKNLEEENILTCQATLQVKSWKKGVIIVCPKVAEALFCNCPILQMPQNAILHVCPILQMPQIAILHDCPIYGLPSVFWTISVS